MRVISFQTLSEFWSRYSDAKNALLAWYDDVKIADWKGPADIKKVYGNASFVTNNRVIFNIKGNHYRLVVEVQYQLKIVRIRFIGTHADYNRIDTTTI